MSLIQKIFLSLFLVIISVYSVYEIMDELKALESNNESFRHVLLEILIVISSFFALLYFIYFTYIQHKAKESLENSLQDVKKSLEGANTRLQQGKKEYLETIYWQFAEWGLSPSEKEISLLLLKGLSIKEIALARKTHEKTVRKQASSVYEKSDLAGRHELSAWFFEDML